MATWQLLPRPDGWDLYHRVRFDPLPAEISRLCTPRPADLQLLVEWLLQPGQAGWWDVIQIGTQQMGVMQVGRA